MFRLNYCPGLKRLCTTNCWSEYRYELANYSNVSRKQTRYRVDDHTGTHIQHTKPNIDVNVALRKLSDWLRAAIERNVPNKTITSHVRVHNQCNNHQAVPPPLFVSERFLCELYTPHIQLRVLFAGESWASAQRLIPAPLACQRSGSNPVGGKVGVASGLLVRKLSMA